MNTFNWRAPPAKKARPDDAGADGANVQGERDGGGVPVAVRRGCPVLPRGRLRMPSMDGRPKRIRPRRRPGARTGGRRTSLRWVMLWSGVRPGSLRSLSRRVVARPGLLRALGPL